jgi:Glycosyl hydrolase 2 galactose-binding domain-like/Exo-beta-D-glucosaminidase Ig-fold domain/Glycosyl hydrolases family 2/NedA-like, galactose-binding domain
MRVPTSSRRTFLKTSIAGATAALGDIDSLAMATAASPRAGESAPGAMGKVGTGTASQSSQTAYTRGIGVYPGSPGEDFSPVLVPDNSNTYRNLALLRPAYHSSSYDYNLTAQLVTDGIKDTRLPAWVETSASFPGTFSKEEREFFLDHNPTSTVSLRGQRSWVQVRLGGGESVPKVDRIDLLVVLTARGVKPANVSFEVSVSDDGRTWKKGGSVPAPAPASRAGYPPEFAQNGFLFKPSIPLNPVSQSRYYRVECKVAKVPIFDFGVQWGIGVVAFFNNGRRVEVGGPYNFTSAWMSAGLGEEWVYVDLGRSCEFDRVALHWIAKAAEGSIQVSEDAEIWRDIQPLPRGTNLTDDIRLPQPARGRYVRIFMTRPTSVDGYILTEMEVYGRGGFVFQPNMAPRAQADGRIDLAGGNWRLQRDSLVKAEGEALSKLGFDDSGWIVATVPGTVLSSYLNIGAIPDPNFGQNQLYISDSFFYADFWYRTEFEAPKLSRDQHAWLNFDGINWKAEIYLNGGKIARIEGGFMRGRFDVTRNIIPGEKNALAVRIIRNDTPGSAKQKTFASVGHNGGALGLDNPTFHASVGWDWISTIRGRNTGIWNDVYLTTSGPVTIENPYVTTALPLPETTSADVGVEVELVNHEAKAVKGTLRGILGDVKFEQKVKLEASASRKIKLNPSTHAGLRLQNPKLWWPAGYSEPNLYDLTAEFEGPRKLVSDTESLKVGVRQMAYGKEGGKLQIWINGRRLVPKGGNWGFSESMLRYRAREYDAAVRYHSDMHFNMIRNWVGQIGRDAFYEACDRHGVMVWQDFWLANPWDGPDPADDDLFLANARDFILRIRNHPSIGLYCGRNEGDPPPRIEEGLSKLLEELHAGIQYIPNSAEGVVSGHGPYTAMPLSYYFGPGANTTLHSERGMQNIPPIESVRLMMPKKALWPQGLDWGLHDFCLQGAANGASYRSIIENGYGGATSAEEWVALAQFVNYEGYRAMFEGQSKNRMGLLIWMSHSCRPSFVWQTYDYYFEPTAAYFGAKKGCEPLHIQWNPVTENVEVVNYSGGNVQGLSAHIQILNMDGSQQWTKAASLDSEEDSTVSCIKMEYPAGLTPVHFLRLGLTHQGMVISRNFFMRPREVGNYRAIRKLPRVNLEASTGIQQKDGRWILATNLRNPSSHPALMVRVKAVREKTGDRILPAIYNDNYLALMPGEMEGIRVELAEADTRGERPQIVVEGFNIGKVTPAERLNR